MQNRILPLTLTLLLLIGTFAIFQFTDLDVRLQDHCYNFERHEWRIKKQDRLPRILFYTGPKVVLAVGSTLVGLWLLLPVRWRPSQIRNWQLLWPVRRVWGVLFCLALVPASIGLIKALSYTPCPWSLTRYGGTAPHLHFFDASPAGAAQRRGQCFPAGHASGGFALLGLYYLGESRRSRWIGLSIGLGAGWTMGIYQMLKGAHFLSHTITTMLLAAIIAQLVAWLLNISNTVAAHQPD